MTQDEAKAIVDGGQGFLSRDAGHFGGNSLMLSAAAGFPDFQTYLHATANGAGGNFFTSNDFGEVWEMFGQIDTPITCHEYRGML